MWGDPGKAARSVADSRQKCLNPLLFAALSARISLTQRQIQAGSDTVAQLILFNKPFQVLSQFSDRDPPGGITRATLADYLAAPGFKVAGRLDYDSEGLLLLTDHGVLQQQIANPAHRQWKTYLVQVEGLADATQLAQLAAGVELADGPSLPARARRIPPPELWPRNPPIRQRRNVPDSWLEISLREGRNRQVRRMTAAVGLPTLRLVRIRVGDWDIAGLSPGEHRRITINMPGPTPPRAGRTGRKRS